MIEATHTFWRGVLEDLNELHFEMAAALAECQANKRARTREEQALRETRQQENWIAFVGGRIFNRFETWYDLEFEPDESDELDFSLPDDGT